MAKLAKDILLDVPCLYVSRETYFKYWESLNQGERVGHPQLTAQRFPNLWHYQDGCWIVVVPRPKVPLPERAKSDMEAQ